MPVINSNIYKYHNCQESILKLLDSKYECGGTFFIGFIIEYLAKLLFAIT